MHGTVRPSTAGGRLAVGSARAAVKGKSSAGAVDALSGAGNGGGGGAGGGGGTFLTGLDNELEAGGRAGDDNGGGDSLFDATRRSGPVSKVSGPRVTDPTGPTGTATATATATATTTATATVEDIQYTGYRHGYTHSSATLSAAKHEATAEPGQFQSSEWGVIDYELYNSPGLYLGTPTDSAANHAHVHAGTVDGRSTSTAVVVAHDVMDTETHSTTQSHEVEMRARAFAYGSKDPSASAANYSAGQHNRRAVSAAAHPHAHTRAQAQAQAQAPPMNLTHNKTPVGADSTEKYCAACTYSECEVCSYCFHNKLSRSYRISVEKIASLIMISRPNTDARALVHQVRHGSGVERR